MANSSNKKTAKKSALTFDSINKAEVPHTRKGKHHDLVDDILQDVKNLTKGAALKVPKSAFGEAKLTNVRAALSRASERAGMSLATSSDDDFLYIWRDE
jgi:hypothetical protein